VAQDEEIWSAIDSGAVPVMNVKAGNRDPLIRIAYFDHTTLFICNLKKV
jgi:hypothetical protein